MSTEAKLFGAYFGVGLVLLILAFISQKAKRGLAAADPFTGEGSIDAGIILLIVLLWPAWLLMLLFANDDDSSRG